MSDDREQKPTISACMIVKNEEKVLSRCLASICESVDEIIIVDTGSTDDSLNIARSFGAKVYCHPWEKDFARHRNQSIGYASGDWILIIDADEELISSTFETLHKAILAPDSVDGIYVCVENASPSGVLQSNSIRIIRNKCGIHYVGRVHNYLAGVTKTMFSDLRFFHHGYNLGRESDEQKFKRTTELLKLDVAEDPYNPRAHHFLAVSYMAVRKYKEAIYYGEKAIELFENREIVLHNYVWSLYVVAGSYLNLGVYEKAKNYAHKAILTFPGYADAHFILCHIYMIEGKRESFRRHYGSFLDIVCQIKEAPEKFGQVFLNTSPLKWKVHFFAGIMALEAGNEKSAENKFQKGFELCLNQYTAHLELARLFRCKKMLDRAIETYEKALEYKQLDCQALSEVAQVYEKKGQEDQGIRFLEGYLNQNKVDLEEIYSTGVVLYRKGLLAFARILFEKFLSFKPNHLQAQVYMARLSFERSDLTGCTNACDAILRALNLNHTFTASTDADLAVKFFHIAENFYQCSRPHLSGQCLQLGRSLISYAAGPKTIHESVVTTGSGIA